MSTEYRRRPAARAGVMAGALGIFCMGASSADIRVMAAAERAAPQSAVQRRVIDYQVTFKLTQDNKEMAPGTDDQITIIFSNRAVDGPKPPRPLFGEDILQEFSFSGMDVVNGSVTFTRRVRDKSFIDARYIRVVNHGSDGWAGDRISVTVDGEGVVSNVPMRPRRGADTSKGFQKFNAKSWGQRTFWEVELQPLRGAKKVY